MWEDYLARFHAERPGITERALEHARDREAGTAYDWLIEPLPADLGHVLDVACGNAALQTRMARRYASYLGIDVSEAEVAQARDLGRGPVRVGDARALPVPDATVDTVVSSMGLMLVRPLSRAIGEIARVLRPGGHAAVLLPATGPLRIPDVGTLFALHRRLRGAWSMPQRPTARDVAREMESVQLRVLDVRSRRFGVPAAHRRRRPAGRGLAVHPGTRAAAPRRRGGGVDPAPGSAGGASGAAPAGGRAAAPAVNRRIGPDRDRRRRLLAGAVVGTDGASRAIRAVE